jgi:hypothetical protein
MSRADRRRVAGDALMIASLGIGVYGASTNHSAGPGHALSVIGAGLGVALTGAYLHWSARPGDSFWREIVASAKPGETRSLDVRACLHEPDATSTSGTDERWTYFLRRPVFEGPATSSYRAVSFTFKDSVLVDVRRSELHVRADEVRPAVPVPLPVGVPN